jgi:hypothetical protein
MPLQHDNDLIIKSEFMKELCKKDKQAKDSGDPAEFRTNEFLSLGTQGDSPDEQSFEFVLKFANDTGFIYITGGKKFGLTDKGRERCKTISDL